MELSREQMASALMSLGYEISRQWQFKLRDEKTPSAKVNMDGSVHDFGSGWHGDLISLLQDFKSFKSFKEAKAEAERLTGLEVKIDFTKFDKSSGEMNSDSLPDHFMFSHRVDRDHNKQAYLKELKQLFLGEYDGNKMLSAEWDEVLKVAKKYEIGFNKKTSRLIMPIRDIDGKIRTFWRYKKEGEDFVKDGKTYKHRKVLYTKQRYRPPFAIADLKEFAKTPNEAVIVCEGEKDALVSNANSLRAISIGGAGASKKIKDDYLSLFKGLKIIICGDYDKAGYEFNINLLEQLKPIAQSVTILDWNKKAKIDGFKLHPKFDLADYFAWKNNNKERK